MRVSVSSCVAVVFVLFVLCISCAENRDPRLAKIKVPIFSEDDFPPPRAGLLTYDIKANMRPPFWPGKGEFNYTALREPGGGFGAPTFGPTYFYRIEGFTIAFSYSQSQAFFGLASGARVLDAQKHLCAEAKLVRLIRPEGKPLQGIEIQEYHYDKLGRKL